MNGSTPDSLAIVPNKPKTRRRNFRISDAVYDAAMDAAVSNGETLTDVVDRALVGYTRRTVTKRAVETRNRNFRVEDAVYDAAMDAAVTNGETLTDVVARALVGYTRRTAAKHAAEERDGDGSNR
ncbi:hypothetical protein [Rhodococcus sp. BS-15]|uniref:hypothetical protein n=1 Tax=Rhodococcus sp. BS-15 TaxID=1304954 RepID=UPI001F43085A|nr:hypothetical protein [Rhodococcus sp. BS-15]